MRNWYERDKRRDQYSALMTGIFAGLFAGLCVCLAIGYALDSWRVRAHERLVREAAASVDARLAECKQLVERIGGSSYSETLAMARQIDGRAR